MLLKTDTQAMDIYACECETDLSILPKFIWAQKQQFMQN